MVEERLIVGLVVERVAPSSPWASWHWLPRQVLPAPAAAAPWTIIAEAADRTRYYAGEAHVHLYSTETSGYRDNLTTGEPKLWVVMQPDGDEPPVRVLMVTADPSEGEASTEAGSNVVATVAMAPEIAAEVAAFVERHHVERPLIKRKRDRARGSDRGPPHRSGDGQPD